MRIHLSGNSYRPTVELYDDHDRRMDVKVGGYEIERVLDDKGKCRTLKVRLSLYGVGVTADVEARSDRERPPALNVEVHCGPAPAEAPESSVDPSDADLLEGDD